MCRFGYRRLDSSFAKVFIRFENYNYKAFALLRWLFFRFYDLLMTKKLVNFSMKILEEEILKRALIAYKKKS